MGRFVSDYLAQAPNIERASTDYTEADARGEFVDRFLEIFGWDVHNKEGRAQSERPVVLERSSREDAQVHGRPDYRIKVAGLDRLPIEAKKPSTKLSGNVRAAIQARSYGYSLSLPAAVLTNVAETIIFDTTVEPSEHDSADVAVRPGCHWRLRDYVARFDEMWAKLASEVVSSDAFYAAYDYEAPPRGESPFDRAFLVDFRRWRLAVATDLAANTALSAPEIGRRTQRILNALLFLRVYEDRNESQYKRLLKAADAGTLPAEFVRANRTFNAEIFLDVGSYAVSGGVLRDVVRGMYWPQTKYSFALLEADTLAALYEQYLAEQVSFGGLSEVILTPKPELAHASGIVTTPQYIVDALLDEAMGSRGQLASGLRLLDPACGSGVFLITAFRRLVLKEELASGAAPSLARRAELVLNHLFGVDIDNEAIEVARLNLLLEILGDESAQASTRGLLPDLSSNVRCGNSLVGPDFDELVPGAAADFERRSAVNPFDWAAKYPNVAELGGFTAIVGNPPYIRIQVLREFASDQLEYFQHRGSQYVSPSAGNFDAYMLFVERCLTLLTSNGVLAFILPHRFTTNDSGAKLRSLLAPRLRKLVHFGVNQVFPFRTTYTALLVAGDPSEDDATLQLVRDLREWRESGAAVGINLPREALGAGIWPIADENRLQVFGQMEASSAGRLGDDNWVHIFVGVQTSSDRLYFLKEIAAESTAELVTFKDPEGTKWQIEREILRKSLKKQPIGQYDIDPDTEWLTIWPYEIVDSGDGTPEAEPFSPEVMAADYPKALAYFERWKPALEKRKMANPGAMYWRYGRHQNMTELDGPKIILQVMSLTPKSAIDTRNLLVTGGGDGGPYYLLRPYSECLYSISVIQAILTHPAVDALIRPNS